MDESGTTDDDSNNNDDASELSSIGSYDEDDNNENNNGRPAVGLETGAPSIKSDFKIAFNQNVPNHRDGKGLENVKEMLELLYRQLAGQMVLLPTKKNMIPTPPPITNINTEWHPEVFEYFFYVYSKEASPQSNANTNVSIRVKAH